MLVSDWLKTATKKLEVSGTSTARLDALVLLEHVTRIDRAKLLAAPEFELVSAQAKILNNLLRQRAQNVPISYLIECKEFYGRNFVISSAVLEPRPESETMIDLLKLLPDMPSSLRVADVGTGSGALGITAALELPNAVIELLEIDPEAAKVAKINVDKFTLSLPVVVSDLLAGSAQNNDVLLCNLPYVPDDYPINLAAAHEPRLALFGGKDGLDLYRALFGQVSRLTWMPLYILSESLPEQHEALKTIARETGYTEFQNNGFIQVFNRAQK